MKMLPGQQNRDEIPEIPEKEGVESYPPGHRIEKVGEDR